MGNCCRWQKRWRRATFVCGVLSLSVGIGSYCLPRCPQNGTHQWRLCCMVGTFVWGTLPEWRRRRMLPSVGNMFQEAVPTAWYILLVLPFQQTPNVVVLVRCNREKGQMWAAFVWGPTTGHVLTEMYSTCYIIIDHGRLGNSWIASPIIPHQQFSPLVVHDTHPDGLSTLRPASFVYTLCWRGMKNFFVLFCFVFLGCADGEWKIFHCCDEHRA